MSGDVWLGPGKSGVVGPCSGLGAGLPSRPREGTSIARSAWSAACPSQRGWRRTARAGSRLGWAPRAVTGGPSGRPRPRFRSGLVARAPPSGAAANRAMRHRVPQRGQAASGRLTRDHREGVDAALAGTGSPGLASDSTQNGSHRLSPQHSGLGSSGSTAGTSRLADRVRGTGERRGRHGVCSLPGPQSSSAAISSSGSDTRSSARPPR